MAIKYRLDTYIYFTDKVSEDRLEEIKKEVNRAARNFEEVEDIEFDTSCEIIPEVGMEVFVSVIEDDGTVSDTFEGKIVELVPVIDADTKEVISESHPVIELKDGRRVYGYECFWTPRPCDTLGIVCEECELATFCSKKGKIRKE